jgi:hypothetical protein
MRVLPSCVVGPWSIAKHVGELLLLCGEVFSSKCSQVLQSSSTCTAPISQGFMSWSTSTSYLPRAEVDGSLVLNREGMVDAAQLCEAGCSLCT